MPKIALEYRNNFLKNISTIKENNPSLFQRITASLGDDLISVAKNGEPTIRVGNLYLESKFDPGRFALRYINGIKKGKGFFIFLGCGLGYHINALLKENGCGILIERSVDIFKAALYILDPEVLCRLTLLIGLGREEIDEKIKDFPLPEAGIVKHAQAVRSQRGYFLDIERTVAERRTQQFASSFTQIESQKLWVKNVLINLSSLREKYYLSEEVLGRFSGPVLLVASGPFLEDIVQEIKKYSSRLPVFSLLPSVPYLLKHEVKPDYILTTDAGFGNRYRMLSKCTIPLITTYSADPSVVKNWSGKVYFFSHSTPLEEELASVKDYSITVPMQGTSSLVMILLARAMGFSDIFLGGYDFANKGLKDHHRGAGFDVLSLACASRTNTWQSQVFRKLYGDRYIRAYDQEGCEVYTSHKLLLYRSWFEAELLGSDVVRLNNGAGINGIKTSHPSILIKYNKERAVFLESMKRIGNRRIVPQSVIDDFRRLKRSLCRSESDLERFGFLFRGESGKPEKTDDSAEMAGFVQMVLNKRLEVLESQPRKDDRFHV